MIKTQNFRSVICLWMAGKKGRLKRSSYYQYKQLIKNHIDKPLGELSLSEITNERICLFFDQLTRCDGKALSASTAKSVIYITKAAIRYAVRCGMMPEPQIFYESPGKTQKRELILDPREENLLTEFLVKHDSPASTGIILALYTGIRIGELCALRWGDIDLDNGIIHIKGTVSRLPSLSDATKTQLFLETPKSESSVRQFPLPDFLLQLLKSRQGNSPADAFLLSGKCDKIPDPRTMQNQFHHALQEAGLPHYNFHVLRHTFATRCVELGFDIKSLSEILGHSSVEITLNRYVHSSMDMKRAQMRLIQRKW